MNKANWNQQTLFMVFNVFLRVSLLNNELHQTLEQAMREATLAQIWITSNTELLHFFQPSRKEIEERSLSPLL